MAADLSLSEAVASLACNAIVDAIDVGGAGVLEIYGDTRAATTDTAVGAQTKLAILTFAATAFGAASAGVATAAAIGSEDSALDTDTATWFRISSGTPAAIMDGNVGTSSADLILNTVSIVTAAVVSISAGTVTQPLT